MTDTTATSLIQSAYREGNLIAVSATPTTAEQTEALTLLNNFIMGVFGYEMGENLSDWLVPSPQRTAPVAANYPQLPSQSIDAVLYYPGNGTSSTYIYPYPPKNSRIVWGRVTNTVYFPEAPMDGSRMAFVQASGAGDSGQSGQVLTLDGNGRQIQDPVALTIGNTVTFTSPNTTTPSWLYRGDLGYWKSMSVLALTDTCPFPPEFDDFWICSLSKRLAPRYGKVTATETVETAMKALARLKARYRQAGVTIYKSSDIPLTSQSYLPGRWWW